MLNVKSSFVSLITAVVSLICSNTFADEAKQESCQTVDGSVISEKLYEIVSHGNLGDIGFLDAKLQTEFHHTSSENKSDGKNISTYRTSTILGYPISSDLFLQKTLEKNGIVMGIIRFYLIENARCSKINIEDIYSKFGVGKISFTERPLFHNSDIVEGMEAFRREGADGTRIYIAYSYNSKTKYINVISIRQDPL